MSTSEHPELEPRMTAKEVARFQTTLRTTRTYLEFGCGGSTRLAAEADVARIFSVDTDRNWIDACKRHPSIAPLVHEGRASFHWANVGPIGQWGYPADESRARHWPSYSLAIWGIVGSELPDTVLVDGRWRVSAAVQTLLRCGPETVLLFHDFHRQAYRNIMPFVRETELVNTLLVCRPKPDLDVRALANLGFASLMAPR